MPEYGPIITAIDEGHFERTGGGGPLEGKCHTCRVEWPCESMQQAQQQQAAYAEKLRLRRIGKDITRPQFQRM